jgi:hypothetical protein
VIHEIGVELAASLASRGCPFRVVDGPEETGTSTFARERIVIEHDDSDSFGPVISQHRNPMQCAVRVVGAKITIYAQSPSVGATKWEHVRRVEHVLDLVICSLREVCVARRQGLSLAAGRLLQPEDLAASPAQGGAVYELRFGVERGIADTKWTGESRPEATVGPGGITIVGTDQITAPGYPVPETAC